MKDRVGVVSGVEGPAEPGMAVRDEIVHAQTRALLAYWERLRAGRSVPYRSQIDPRHMDCDVGNVFVVEVLEGGTQRFRLAGSRLIDTFGMELRGLPVRSIMEGRARDTLTALIAETLAEPGIGYARLCPGAGGTEVWEMLLLPLRSEGGGLDRLIGLMFQLAGGRDLRRLMPLKLTLERMSIQPIEIRQAGEEAGFAEQQTAFSGMPAPAGSGRLTAIEGGGGASGRPRSRPALRVVEDD